MIGNLVKFEEKDITARAWTKRESLLRGLYESSSADARMLARIYISDSNALVRSLAVEVLGERPEPGDFFRLRERLTDADWLVRANAVEAVASINGPQDAQRILRLLRKDPNPTVRAEAAISLADVAQEGSRETLENVLDQEEDLIAKAGIYAALIRMGNPEYFLPFAELLDTDSIRIFSIVSSRLTSTLESVPEPPRDVVEKALSILALLPEDLKRKAVFQEFSEFLQGRS